MYTMSSNKHSVGAPMTLWLALSRGLLARAYGEGSRDSAYPIIQVPEGHAVVEWSGPTWGAENAGLLLFRRAGAEKQWLGSEPPRWLKSAEMV